MNIRNVGQYENCGTNMETERLTLEMWDKHENCETNIKTVELP